MLYIATWNWQLLAILFLICGFIMFSLPRTLATQAFFVAFILVFIMCQAIVFIRKKQLREGEDETS